MKELPEYLDNHLKIISIGLNPSPVSVNAGYYFANPRNRFWVALNGSRLVNEPLQPGKDSMQKLFTKYRIGFTDLVRKPTKMANELRAADYRQGAPDLQEKLLQYQPQIAWFHGSMTYRNYLKYTEAARVEVTWGLQKETIGTSRVFVTPNPSPANARYSVDDLIRFYNEMVSFQIRELFGLG